MKWFTLLAFSPFLWHSVSPTRVVPGKYIVEFVDNLSTQQETEEFVQFVSQELKELDIGVQVDKQFNRQGIFVGIALTLDNDEAVAVLQTSKNVKRVWPVTSIPAPEPVESRAVDVNDPSVNFTDTQGSHIATGIDKVHAEGNFGQGIKIAIIDTGIDYTHASLGGGFGPGYKVTGGYDFVGDNYIGGDTPAPDDDPMDCGGHGTHVAGIIAANPGNAFNISGAAHGANLTAYRVFGCEGGSPSDIIIEALIEAEKDGNHVINLSLGNMHGWSENPVAVVASRIARRGIVVVASAGNGGDQGFWLASNLASGYGVIATASTDDTTYKAQISIVNGGQLEHAPIPYLSTLPLKITNGLALYFTSNTTTIPNDACDSLPESTPDLSNYLVIIRRGICTFTQKLENVAKKGAKFALVYDNGRGLDRVDMGTLVPAALIRAEDGAWLLEQYLAGNNVTLSFPQTGGAVELPNPKGGLMSAFSSFGPTFEANFAQSVAAPGGSILSTYPVAKGGWQLLSGTSMSTPLVAGCAALILAAKGSTSEVGLKVQRRLESSATLLRVSHDENARFQTLSLTGGGLVNVHKAIHTNTSLSTTRLLLNDTAHFVGTHEFTVTNEGETEQTYQLQHVPAATANTMTADGVPGKGPISFSNDTVLLSLSLPSFTLQPGQNQIVTADFTIPANVPTQLLPVFSGAIVVKSADESVQVLYLGVAGNLTDQKVLSPDTEYFNHTTPLLIDQNGKFQDDNATYTWASEDHPDIIFRLSFGSPKVVIDLVEVNVTVPGITVPPPVEDDSSRSATRRQIQFPTGGSFAEVETIGHIETFEYRGRNDNSEDVDKGHYRVDLTPTFFNGTNITNGHYRYLVRALKVFGNAEDQKNYESWLSPVVGFNRSVG